jgi:methylated-DNA-protein-cysteine methyltransferase-like protein
MAPNRDFEALEELSELSDDELDEIRRELTEFKDRVYWLVRQIPEGGVATYGQIALYAGSPRAARAVGQILKRTLGAEIRLPWHRVINAQGGISHRGDVARAKTQRRWLRDEGVVFGGDGTCDLSEYRWEPDVVFWEETGEEA